MKKITQEQHDEICNLLYEEDGISLFYDRVIELIEDEEFKNSLSEDEINSYLFDERMKQNYYLWYDENDKTLEDWLYYYKTTDERPTSDYNLNCPLIKLAGIDLEKWHAQQLEIASISPKREYEYSFDRFCFFEKTNEKVKEGKLTKGLVYSKLLSEEDVPKLIEASNKHKVVDVHFGIHVLINIILAILFIRLFLTGEMIWTSIIVYFPINMIFSYIYHFAIYLPDIRYTIHPDNVVVDNTSSSFDVQISPSSKYYLMNIINMPITLVISLIITNCKEILSGIYKFIINNPYFSTIIILILCGIMILFIKKYEYIRDAIFPPKDIKTHNKKGL